ncbi:MAG: 50S ribosomal protein L19 [Patescibacteria group bacterium]
MDKKQDSQKQEDKQDKKRQTQKDDRDKVRAGMIVSVHEKVVDTTPKGEIKERIQIFKGMVLARKHGNEPGASITVRKDSDGVGVEKIFPVHSPLVDRIVIDKVFKIRRAKLYFLRDSKKKLREMK